MSNIGKIGLILTLILCFPGAFFVRMISGVGASFELDIGDDFRLLAYPAAAITKEGGIVVEPDIGELNVNRNVVFGVRREDRVSGEMEHDKPFFILNKDTASVVYYDEEDWLAELKNLGLEGEDTSLETASFFFNLLRNK